MSKSEKCAFKKCWIAFDYNYFDTFNKKCITYKLTALGICEMKKNSNPLIYCFDHKKDCDFFSMSKCSKTSNAGNDILWSLI